VTADQGGSEAGASTGSVGGAWDCLWRTGEVGPKHEWAKRFTVGNRVLDLGAGTGSVAAYLAREGHSVTAMDLAPAQVAAATSISWTIGHARALPFRSGAFDTSLLFDVLEHVEDQDRVLEEIRRVTVQRLLISVPSADDGALPKYNLTYKHHKDRTHLRTYGAEQLINLLVEHDFAVVELTPSGPVWPHLLTEFTPSRFGRRVIGGAIDLGLRMGLLANPGLYADILAAADCI